MKPKDAMGLPHPAHLNIWLENRIERSANWSSSMFRMEWDLHEDDEEWVWRLGFKDPDSGRGVAMAYGLSHVKNVLNNFLVSEILFTNKAWQARENGTAGWKIVNALTQITAFNVMHHGINHTSVLAGMVESAGTIENGTEALYFRPFGQWYSSRTHKFMPIYTGDHDGCEYLRPIPLSEDESAGVSYLSVDDNIWDYIDADAETKERQTNEH